MARACIGMYMHALACACMHILCKQRDHMHCDRLCHPDGPHVLLLLAHVSLLRACQCKICNVVKHIPFVDAPFVIYVKRCVQDLHWAGICQRFWARHEAG